ncbi:MAG: ABC transporter ATP-binding protein/permease [Pirellulales bacterium]|nr:ABC transporter ATP-binding protein/permease [Pirellulales bacterium]
MKNFLRAVRLALSYRWTVAFAMISALMIGVLWGANIGTVYPFVEVAFKGQSLHSWVEDEITDAELSIAGISLDELPKLEAQLETAQGDEAVRVHNAISQRNVELEARREDLKRAKWLKPYIVSWLPDNAFQTLIIIAVALLIGTIIKGIFIIINNIMEDRLALLATFDLRKMLFRNSLSLDVVEFGADGGSDLMSRFTFDMENIVAGLRALFGKAVREPLKMIACLIGAAFICWRLLIFSLILAPVMAFIIRWIAKVLKRANRRAMEEMSQIYGRLEESFQGVKVVKAFTMESYERQQFHQTNKKYYLKAMRIARYEAINRPVTEMMGVATILMALLGGAYLVLNDATHLLGIRMCERPISLSALMLFYGLLSGVSDPARKLSDVYSKIQRAVAASDRVFELLDRKPKVRDPENPVALPKHRKQITLKDVSFAYVPSQPVLQNVNLTVEYGETIAIVGPNGCGKSTLLNMLPRFFDPQTGSVQVDGVDIRDARLRDLRRQIGMVNQETLLFDDTIANNIRYGRRDASQVEIVTAAKAAHADKFICEKLDNGYETSAGSGGQSLSGGQRQRIALARAILRDPAILILDEATSQIDLESEQLIHKVLEEFTRDRTTFIITHRLSTLTLADRILVMDGGTIIDSGTHDDLIGRCALYRRLHDLQFRESA